MHKLPYGESEFEKIREKGYVYIDKTMYIEELEKNASFVHFLRPRRFGKSLFTSMLECYYDIKKKNEFESLFGPCSPLAKGTYIYDHPTPERNDYYVLRLDFSGLNTDDVDSLKRSFHNTVYSKCLKFIETYGFDVHLEKGIDAADCFNQFKDRISNKIEHRLYVIIDEYDHFANELLSFHFHDFQFAVSKNGYVRKFYETLKSGTVEGVIGRIFVTGVSPISLDSMTSGYNISTNLSLDPHFHEMMGFTSEEVQGLISTIDHITEQEKVLGEMKQYYDGYLFAEEAQHHLFNPNMVLYYLNYYQRFGKAPREIVDRNIYSDYSKLEQLLKITENLDLKESEREDHKVNVQRLLDGEHPSVVITSQFTLIKRFNDQDFFSLLFYLGYLTIDHVEEFELTMKIPNMVMKKVFINYFQSMLEQELDFQADIKAWQSAIASFITKNDASLYIQEIERTLHKYSDRVFMNFKEKNIQQIGEMIIGAITGVDSDLEDENDGGYSDHVIIPINPKHHRKLIEYKYLKVNYTETQLQNAINEAKVQINLYKSSRQIHRYQYDVWIMIFSKDTCVYSESVETVER